MIFASDPISYLLDRFSLASFCRIDRLERLCLVKESPMLLLDRFSNLSDVLALREMEEFLGQVLDEAEQKEIG